MDSSGESSSRPRKKPRIQKLITDFSEFVQAGNRFLQTYTEEIDKDAMDASAFQALGSLEESLTDLSQELEERREYKADRTSITLSPSEWAEYVGNKSLSETESAGPTISFTKSASETLFNGLQHYLDGIQSYMDHQAGSDEDTEVFEQSHLNTSEDKSEDPFVDPNISPIPSDSEPDSVNDGKFASDNDDSGPMFPDLTPTPESFFSTDGSTDGNKSDAGDGAGAGAGASAESSGIVKLRFATS